MFSFCWHWVWILDIFVSSVYLCLSCSGLHSLFHMDVEIGLPTLIRPVLVLRTIVIFHSCAGIGSAGRPWKYRGFCNLYGLSVSFLFFFHLEVCIVVLILIGVSDPVIQPILVSGICYLYSFHLEVCIVVPILIGVSDAVIQPILVSGICYLYPCSALDYFGPACNL